MQTSKPIVGIHLDLKYAIASKAYLMEWVAELPALGINTLLLEYEDKFPYKKYPFLQAHGAFTPDELKKFLSIARKAGLRVIPLVQTLSHLEYALAHDQLADLRELEEMPTQINIGNPKAIEFVQDMLEEVLAYHTEDEWIHIGGDEAWHLGKNPKDAELLARRGVLGMWEDHMTKMVNHVIALGKRPVVWDDIYWSRLDQVAGTILPRQTILCCWAYAMSPKPESLANGMKRVQTYHDAGFETIGAPCLNWGVMTPRHEAELRNAQAWMMVMHEKKMAGVINTAWACFHVLPFAQNYYIAATGQFAVDSTKTPDEQWHTQYVRQHFGCEASQFSRALELCTGFYEQAVPGLARPVTPMVYGYMDMVLVYESIEQRMAQGGYPLGIMGVDYDWLFQRKLEVLRTHEKLDEIITKFNSLIVELTEAITLLKPLAQNATRHQAEAKYLCFATEFKLANARVMLDLLTGKRDDAARAQWLELGPKLQNVLTPLVEPSWIPFFMSIWWQPMAHYLQGKLSRKTRVEALNGLKLKNKSSHATAGATAAPSADF